MQVIYDPNADAMYIRLNDHAVLRSKQISESVAIDFDEAGGVIGFEVLHVSQSDIDPTTLELKLAQPVEKVERPDQALLREQRAARMQAIKQQRQAKVTGSAD